jgi:DNA-binding MarR family transcriptional regulator
LSILKSDPRFTEKQGQYLAFIHTYAVLNRRPPAEADMQAFFGVTPPSVHRMIVDLEQRGLIRRTPRQARTIEVCLPIDEIPRLEPQPVHSSVARY